MNHNLRCGLIAEIMLRLKRSAVTRTPGVFDSRSPGRAATEVGSRSDLFSQAPDLRIHLRRPSRPLPPGVKQRLLVGDFKLRKQLDDESPARFDPIPSVEEGANLARIPNVDGSLKSSGFLIIKAPYYHFAWFRGALFWSTPSGLRLAPVSLHRARGTQQITPNVAIFMN